MDKQFELTEEEIRAIRYPMTKGIIGLYDVCKQIAQAQLDKKVTKKGRECQRCKGLGAFFYKDGVHEGAQEENPCKACQGTGRLPDEVKTVREIVKEWQGGK